MFSRQVNPHVEKLESICLQIHAFNEGINLAI